jgi:hypothetical protein
MSATVHALPIVGHAARIGAEAGIFPDGSIRLYRDRRGDAWAGVELWARGPGGACYPVAILHPIDARALADRLVAEAARLELAQRSRIDAAAAETFCQNARHSTPCPLPCDACAAECPA